MKTIDRMMVDEKEKITDVVWLRVRYIDNPPLEY
jgi:hypothetical protein